MGQGPERDLEPVVLSIGQLREFFPALLGCGLGAGNMDNPLGRLLSPSLK